MTSHENGSSGSIGEGNSKLPNISKKRCSAAKHWLFTLWALSKNDESQIVLDVPNFDTYPCWGMLKKNILNSGLVEKLSYQLEWNETHTNVHMQGALSYYTKGRPIENFCDTKKLKETHWEVMSKKSTPHKMMRYTWKKDGSEIPGSHWSNFPITKDLLPIKDRMEGLTWKPWQLEIKDMIRGEPDARKIFWYYDTVGNVGKTTFAHHLGLAHGAIIVSSKADDIKHAIVKMRENEIETDLVVFCIPRDKESYVSYAALEEIKDGMFFSGKYESCQYIGNIPHVFVFANFKPDTSKLSADRWDVRNITEVTYEFM